MKITNKKIYFENLEVFSINAKDGDASFILCNGYKDFINCCINLKKQEIEYDGLEDIDTDIKKISKSMFQDCYYVITITKDDLNENGYNFKFDYSIEYDLSFLYEIWEDEPIILHQFESVIFDIIEKPIIELSPIRLLFEKLYPEYRVLLINNYSMTNRIYCIMVKLIDDDSGEIFTMCIYLYNGQFGVSKVNISSNEELLQYNNFDNLDKIDKLCHSKNVVKFWRWI